MSAFLKFGRTIRTLKIRTSTGQWRQRSAKTRDRDLVRSYQQMIDELGPRGRDAQDVLDCLIDRRFSVPDLYKLWIGSGRNLRDVRRKLHDVDVSAALNEWEKWLLSRASGIATDTANHYIQHVRQGIPKGSPFPRSEFTPTNIQKMLDRMGNSAPATVRKAGAAFSSAARFLRKRGVIRSKVMADIDLPAAGNPRDLYLDTSDAIKLAEAQGEPYRTFSALLAGTGIEVSAALKLRRRDVDVKHREIRAPGTKTYNRDRVVRVAEWAWPYLKARLNLLLPDARIFAEIPDRWKAGDAHRAGVAKVLEKFPIDALGSGYTMRDARHTYAVRAAKAGTPLELIAKQLGHRDASMVLKVYGKFVPSQRERDHWERIAAARDRAAKQEQGKRK